MTTKKSATTETNAAPASARRLRWYFACLIAVPLLGWLAAFRVVRWPAYWRHDPSLIGTMCNYADSLTGRADDVVIFGDSSAMFGIDAGLLSHDLGLNAVNLPNTMGTIHVIDDAGLKRFLAANRPPKLIVFYFSAWNLDYRREHVTGLLYEGEVALQRRGTWAQLSAFARAHPEEVVAFPMRFWEQVGFAYALERADFHQHARDMARMHGNLPDRGGDDLTPDCAIPTKLVNATGRATINALVREYSAHGQHVVVYLSPMPACPGAAIVAGRSYGVDSPPIWPVDRFRDDGSFAHLDPAAVPESTRRLEEAVRAELQRTNAAGTLDR